MKAFLILLLALAVLGRIDLDETDSVELGTTEQKELEITSNPTTGYMWYMLPEDTNKIRVEKITGEYEAPSGNLLGQPGKQVFKISCTEECTAGDKLKLKMLYKRPWEDQPGSVKTFEVRVVN